jgi:lysophospholipase L1-like esterase
MIRITSVVCAACILAACIEEDLPQADVLAIGDSVIWWNSDTEQSVADVISDDLQRQVTNAAIPGAAFLGGLDSIPGQYQRGTWDWVVLDGGANDLGDFCGTDAAGSVLDRMIASDLASGAVPGFLARVREDGPQVVIMGYYLSPQEGGDFAGCTDDFAVLNMRLMQYAEQSEGVYFISAQTVIDPANPAHYDPDLVHPSPLGSRLIGRQIAEVIRSAPPL